MSIRIASVKDTKVLTRVHAASWQAAYRGILPEQLLNQFTVDEWEDHFRSAIELPATITAVAERDGNIMGYTIIGPSRDEDLDDRLHGEIWGLYVDPVHWNKNIGTELTDWACSEFLTRHCEMVTLWVYESNLKAKTFYEKRGFALDGAKKKLSSDTPLALRYRKRLDAI